MHSPHEIPDLLGPIGYNAMYLPQLVRQCQTAGIVPFVGAGLSAPCGFPQWGTFLLSVAKDSGLKAAIQAKLDALEYAEAASVARERLGWRLFEDLLQHAFGDKNLPAGPITGAVAQLPQFRSGPLVTTNFDRVIETAFGQAQKPLLPVWHSQAVKGSEALQRNEPFLLKLHGDWQDMEKRVLTQEEYQVAYGDDKLDHIDNLRPVPQLLNILLAGRSCLFLGCSLKQDRTMKLLKTIANTYKTTHYAAVARPAGESEFEARIRELSDLGICPIWYPPGEHGVLEPLLQYLAAKSTGAPRPVSRAARPEPPNNIPRPPNPTVGRTEEVQQVAALFRGARLVTVMGGGGCGKSRAAIETAYEIRHQFPEGVWFVDLASLSEKADKENLLPARIGRVAGVPQQPSQPPLKALIEQFSAGKHLLLLDNCEHLASSCCELLRDLLPLCPGLQVLATSRIPLKLAEERIFLLATLRVPRIGADMAELQTNESVELFRARAGINFEITEANATAIVELCRALDGIPLAIEVAAARLGVRSVQQMNKESRRLLSLLEDVEVDDLRHWRTVNAALEWSYKLLAKPVRDFLRPLAVFDGGWTGEWAAAIHDATPKAEDLLQKLLDNSMIVSGVSQGVTRFRFLEPVRQFVRSKLTPQESAKHERAHADIFRRLAEQAGPLLLGDQQQKWLGVLQEEIDNLRAALRWSLEHKETEVALRIAGHWWRFWEIRGYFTEGRERAAEVLAMPGVEAYPEFLEKTFSGAGWLAYRQADFSASESLIRQALTLAEKRDRRDAIANALNDLGNIARIRGDYTLACERLERALEIERIGGSARMVAVILYNLGAVAMDQGDLNKGSMKLAESLDLFREQSNLREIAFPLRCLAEIALLRGNPGVAREYADESLQLRVDLNDSKGRADTGCTLAWIEIEDGNTAAAQVRLTESLSFAKAIGDRRTISEALEVGALVHARLGNISIAVQLVAGASHLRARIGFALPPVKKKHMDAVINAAKTQLGDSQFLEVWQRGESREINALIDLAIHPADPR